MKITLSLFSVGLVTALFVWFFIANKEQFAASAFGAFVGVGLGVVVGWYAEAAKDKEREEKNLQLLDSLAQNCLTLTNSNLVVFNEMVGKKVDEIHELKSSFARLLVTLASDRYLVLLNTGLQFRLKHDLEHTILYANAKVNDLKGYVSSRNVLGQDYFGTSKGTTILNEWEKLIPWLKDNIDVLTKLKKMLANYLDDRGVKNYE